MVASLGEWPLASSEYRQESASWKALSGAYQPHSSSSDVYPAALSSSTRGRLTLQEWAMMRSAVQVSIPAAKWPSEGELHPSPPRNASSAEP